MGRHCANSPPRTPKELESSMLRQPNTRCSQCGAPVFRFPSALRQHVYCSHACVGASKSEPDEIRFRRYVEEHDGESCWGWLASHFPNGYGSFNPKGSARIGTHRFAYMLAHGIDSIPDGQSVLHRCDNPGCVRPDHLFLGSPADNMLDKVAKSRQSRGERSRRTHLTAANVQEMRMRNANGESYAQLGRAFGITSVNVSMICRRKTWKHVE